MNVVIDDAWLVWDVWDVLSLQTERAIPLALWKIPKTACQIPHEVSVEGRRTLLNRFA